MKVAGCHFLFFFIIINCFFLCYLLVFRANILQAWWFDWKNRRFEICGYSLYYFFFQFSLFSLIDNVREYIYIRELNCLYLLPSFFGTEFNRKRLSLDKRDHFFFRISFLLNDDRVFLLKFFLFVLLNYLLITIIFSTYSTQHSAYSTNNTTYPANNTTILFVITDQTLLIL